ncbi:hypothetical protein FZEAL_10600 [Fusarium zealandicum]|uniref:Mucoidy inhibitor-like protein n=1 Tax=Fusarium zealandicum TaxID=1053134 RepID=A0A8H4TZ88_9HYPO|nr:hypothetical protein FZEAL_10600 [Fusarium zealandicum]
MDVTHKVEYKVRDLATRSVTLFPAQAQIKREIQDVPLKPGTNVISIVGLSPTIDKHSVTVDGSGAATITGISVEFLPNREIFDEVYPDSDADDSKSEEDDSDDSDHQPEQQGLMEVKIKLVSLRDDFQQAKEAIANAEERIKILDAYSKSVVKRSTLDISDVLQTYKQEREKACDERMAASRQERSASHAVTKASAEYTRLSKLDKKLKTQASKARNKVQKFKAKQQEKEAKRLEEHDKEKARVRNERARCWPKYCYTLHIQLEVNPAFTPASSRRESVSSDVDVVKRSPSKTVDHEETPACDLLISYITNSAFWTPSYDLQLSTVKATGTLCFDAGLHNTTSETWEDCKITLSTSHASSSSMDDSTPILAPWHIKMAGKGFASPDTNVMNSREERSQQQSWLDKKAQATGPVSMPRHAMFGIDRTRYNVPSSDYQMQLMLLEQANTKRFMAARQEQDSMPEASRSQAMQQQAMQQQAMQQQAMQQQAMQQQQQTAHYPLAVPMDAVWGEDGIGIDEEDTLMSDVQPSLEFQDSLVEETGFTTTYDLPGLKTLVPKFTVSKQRVARIHFSNVYFSHTVVAKYQPAAYLKAKLRNNSKLTLLRGPASLTLDGSFMGQAKIPRCSSGGLLNLGLGVDSAIKVMYPKPDVHRSTTGMFSKENSSVYVRTITVQNMRVSAAKAANLLVLDQIPVSEDDRLRVDLVTPRGLILEGPRQPAGAPGREMQEDEKWGKATAALKKGGQVSWEVSLNPGKAVKLGLEYSVSMPSGDVAQEC